jgi:hypothetical protein
VYSIGEQLASHRLAGDGSRRAQLTPLLGPCGKRTDQLVIKTTDPASWARGQPRLVSVHSADGAGIGERMEIEP